jgi:hypothetical protein
MDLAQVKQEQGETLRQYMCRFFDQRVTVVDVTDKEVIDIFQDDLYHRHTFEDFNRRRLSSISKLKDMITSWVDKEDMAITKYESNVARARMTWVATTRTRVVATTTRVPIVSASQTTLSWQFSALRRITAKRPRVASRTAQGEVSVVSGE